jgi:hypothetical protein
MFPTKCFHEIYLEMIEVSRATYLAVTSVILCGGSGTRLWPLSRTGFPKQFLCLTGQDSLFQQAATRLAQLGNTQITVARPLLVTGEDHIPGCRAASLGGDYAGPRPVRVITQK